MLGRVRQKELFRIAVDLALFSSVTQTTASDNILVVKITYE